MKLIGITDNKVTKDKNGFNEPRLEITEVELVQCNIISNEYQQNSSVLYTVFPNESFDQLLDVSSKEVYFKKHLKFSLTKVWFTDQTFKLLEIEHKINIILIINLCTTYKKWYITQLNLEVKYLRIDMDICLLLKILVKIRVKGKW